MDVPFFVAFSAILLLGRYLPFALPLLGGNDDDGDATRATRLVSMQCSEDGQEGRRRQHQCPAEVAMEGRALWLNSAALFLGMILGRPPWRCTRTHHLTRLTETIAITAFAHDVCIFFEAVGTTKR
ncbi:hypothetical protein BS78_07G157300 [Paspalum vaginatum]|nr:hypothetical protein BS78_07G157300 [Paspalum vaginatum]